MSQSVLTSNNWSEAAWQMQLPLFAQTKQRRFIQALMAGTLAQDRFDFYIEQDALYLQAFSRLLRSMAARLPEPKFQQYFIDFVEDNMAAEEALHSLYLKKPISDIKPTATCEGFIQFNEQLAHEPNVELALAGMLPCFIVYQQLGIYIYANHQRVDNPYLAWIDMYAGAEHAESVTKLREICDAYATRAPETLYQEMFAYYREGCLWDQKFWDSCYIMF